MATIGSLIINLVARTAGFSAGMRKAKADVAGFQASLSGLGTALGGLGLAIGGAFVLKSVIAEAAEAEASMAQLRATLASTGGAAGLTAEQIDALAANLQRTTMFSDETTQSAAAVLATFTNVRGDLFTSALVAAQNLSTVLKQDLTASVRQVGKALNDPTGGGKILKSLGVTTAQIASIKALADVGDAMGARLKILAILNEKFGGSAEAAGKTFSGQLAILKNQISDLKEQLGGLAIAIVRPFIGAIQWTLDYSRGLAALVIGLSAMKLASMAAAAAQAFLLALSGPAGWVQLGIGVAAATAAYATMDRTLGGVAATASAAQAPISQMTDAANESAVTAKKSTDAWKSLDDTIRGIKFDADTMGFSDLDRELAEFKKKLDETFLKQYKPDATPFERRALTATFEDTRTRGEAAIREKHADKDRLAIEDKIKELAKENADFGKEAEEIRLRELKAMKGINDEQKKEADALAASIAAKRQEKEATDELAKAKKKADQDEKEMKKRIADAGHAVFEATLTDAEKYQKALIDIGRLRANEAIDQNTANRAQAKAFFDFRSAQLAQNQPVEFLERGSAAEISARFAAKGDPLAKLDETAQAQLVTQLEASNHLRNIVELSKDDKVFTIGS